MFKATVTFYEIQIKPYRYFYKKAHRTMKLAHDIRSTTFIWKLFR